MYISGLEANDFSRDTYDCVIIGGGIIGLYLASCSAFEGLKIALVPGGPKEESHSNLNSSQSGISNEEISENFHQSRPWVLGGASRIWGGRFREFDQWDIEGRDYLDLKSWPIDWNTMRNLYEKVVLELNLGEIKTSFEELELWTLSTDLDFTGREFWLNEKNFTTITGSKIGTNPKIRVFENFVYLKTLTNNLSNPKFQIQCKDSKEGKLILNASTIVFASGAVENIRHLHNFQKEHQSMLGSRNENLGKKFMIHLLTKFPHIDSPRDVGFEFERKQGLNYKRTVQLKRNFQEKYGLANSLGTFSPGEVNLLNVFDLTNSGSRILKRYGRDFPKELYLRAPYLKSLLKNQFSSKIQGNNRSSEQKSKSVFSIWGEQIPNSANEVQVSQLKDKNGVNKVNIQISLNEFDIHSLALSASYYELLLKNDGNSDCNALYKRNRELVEESLLEGPNWGHQMGGTPMGLTRANGVVDSYGESFDFPGVFVCGTSVFPSGSHAAPTLTALALSQNTAQRVKLRVLQT
jgi:hypothetical protein